MKDPLNRTGINDELKRCDNPRCVRRVPVGVMYCCRPCGAAREGKYEIHEAGSLAHTGSCDQRHAQRSGAGATGDERTQA